MIKYTFNKTWFIGTIFLLSLMPVQSLGSFRSEQKKHLRVRNAYAHKEKQVKKLFKEKNRDYNSFEMILVGFKLEKELCVYVRDAKNKKYKILKKYPFCVLSGSLGPKRKEGDNQVPEGLYEISNFNPASNYHLSLRVNYPNASDKVLSNKAKPGSDIYIHGSCVSIGCIPITDALIEELYVLAVETRNRAKTIPVYLFPCRMTTQKMKGLKLVKAGKKVEGFWTNLQKAYLLFSKNASKLTYSVDKKGQYIFD